MTFTSDLHVDVTRNNGYLVPYLAQRAAAMAGDVFVLAGDIAGSLAVLDATLAQFERLDGTKVLVPGNHDIWVSKSQARKGRDSFYNYREAIPQLCARHGFICPTLEPCMIADVGIIANIGWYDYSLQDPRLSATYNLHDYERGIFGHRVWNDTRHAVWLRHPDTADWRARQGTLRNSEVFARFIGELTSATLRVPASIQKLLFVLHTAPFRECITPKPEPSPFDAYEGSVALGEFIEAVVAGGREAWVICGHRHKPLFLQRGNIRLYRSPIGYLGDAETDYGAIAKRAVGECEI